MADDPAVARTPKVTLNDVAMAAGVDRSVVSRVISEDPRLSVRPQTRQRVQETVRRLGYRPNLAARSLRTARAYLFGLFVSDLADQVYAQVAEGAELAASRLDCGLMIASAAGVRRGSGCYRDMLGQGRVDGVLLAGDDTGPALDALRTAAVPWVLLNRRPSGSRRQVMLDNEHAVELGVRHLVELGHRHIERLAEHSPAAGSQSLARMLSAPDPPTGVVVADVNAAVGVLHAAHAAGVAVPAELSVVAVADVPLAAHLVPSLTTVRMPLRELGRRGIEVLAEHGPSEEIDEVVRGPIELVVRGSTGPPR